MKKKLKKARENEAFILNEVAPEKKQESSKEKDKEMVMEKTEADKDKKAEEKDKNKKDEAKKEDDKKAEEREKEKKEEEKEKKEEEKRENIMVKGFETIYRLTATNHMRLNAIADRKANIMLTLNGIVISITMSIVASDSGTNPRLIIPTSLLIISCLITIIFATLATRPTVTTGRISREAIESKKANLLFFGNFSRMELQDFDWGLRSMMRDREYLHNAMIEDFYNLGRVLDQKFRYLRICYNVFMYGIIISVVSIAVLIAFGF